MHILMKSVRLGWNVTHVASFGKLKLYLIPTYIIYASLLSQVEFYLSFQARTSPALCAMQKCHQICQKRFALCETSLIKFYQLISLWMFGNLIPYYCLRDLAYSQGQICSFIISWFFLSSFLMDWGEVFLFLFCLYLPLWNIFAKVSSFLFKTYLEIDLYVFQFTSRKVSYKFKLLVLKNLSCISSTCQCDLSYEEMLLSVDEQLFYFSLATSV